MAQEHTFGWRDLLRAVNLRDFTEMVAGEAAQIATSLRLAAQAALRLPFGPLFFLGGLVIALLRLLLLILVVLVFGTGILLISAVRGVIHLVRGTARG